MNNAKLGLVSLSIFFFLVGMGVQAQMFPADISVEAVEAVEEVVPTPTPTLEPTPQSIPTDIEGYIKYKFGKHADKAFEILSCENKNLDPYAINDNTTWGGVGIDRGYWQINNVYHPSVSDWCASDVECSTNYAFRMFENDGETFRRWACGKY